MKAIFSNTVSHLHKQLFTEWKKRKWTHYKQENHCNYWQCCVWSYSLGEGLPSNGLLEMCCWTRSHFHNSTDCNGVTLQAASLLLWNLTGTNTKKGGRDWWGVSSMATICEQRGRPPQRKGTLQWFQTILLMSGNLVTENIFQGIWQDAMV